MNMAGDEVLPSSVKKNSENLIVLPTLPVMIVSPSFGCKNLIFSLIIMVKRLVMNWIYIFLF